MRLDGWPGLVWRCVPALRRHVRICVRHARTHFRMRCCARAFTPRAAMRGCLPGLNDTAAARLCAGTFVALPSLPTYHTMNTENNTAWNSVHFCRAAACCARCCAVCPAFTVARRYWPFAAFCAAYITPTIARTRHVPPPPLPAGGTVLPCTCTCRCPTLLHLSALLTPTAPLSHRLPGPLCR